MARTPVTGFRHESQLFIGGKWVDASGGTYEVVNPATEEVVGPGPQRHRRRRRGRRRGGPRGPAGLGGHPAGERPALMARAAARHPGQCRRAPPPRDRRDRRHRRGGLDACRCRWPLTASSATPATCDLWPSGPCRPRWRVATPLAPGRAHPRLAHRASRSGVVACITSYNFPLVNMAGKVAPALAMGNTVVVKPAPQDPLAVVELVADPRRGRVPARRRQPGRLGSTPRPAAALVESTGRRHGQLHRLDRGRRRASPKPGARTMKRLLLELGGKGALPRLRRRRRRQGGHRLHRLDVGASTPGQICTAPTRAIVHRSVFDQVVEQLRRYATALKVGDPTDLDTIVGPLISAAQRDRVEGYIATGRGRRAPSW